MLTWGGIRLSWSGAEGWGFAVISKLLKGLKPQNSIPPGQEKLPLIKLAEKPLEFERYVFICGLHRSGTTMLEQHLRGRYALTVLSAPVPENEGQHLQDVFPAAIRHGGPGRFAFSPAMRMRAAPAGEVDRLRSRLLQCWTPWASDPTPTLLEKSPPHLMKIGWLRSVFPGGQFIIMTRDPRAVAAATMKWSRTSFEELVFHWHVAHQAALEDEGPDCIRVRYETYCEDPNAELGRIAAFLNLTPAQARAEDADRFKDVRNSNDKYLTEIEPRNLGTGVWTQFGYSF